MTTVSEFIKYLETLPQNAIVETIKEVEGNWGSSYVRVVDVELPENGYSDTLEVIDFRDNHFTKPDAPHFGKVYLRIGQY